MSYSYDGEIIKTNNELGKLRKQLEEDINNRIGILNSISNEFMSNKFSVVDARYAIDSIIDLKTNKLTKLVKDIYDLETYLNYIKVEQMSK